MAGSKHGASTARFLPHRIRQHVWCEAEVAIEGRWVNLDRPIRATYVANGKAGVREKRGQRRLWPLRRVVPSSAFYQTVSPEDRLAHGTALTREQSAASIQKESAGMGGIEARWRAYVMLTFKRISLARSCLANRQFDMRITSGHPMRNRTKWLLGICPFSWSTSVRTSAVAARAPDEVQDQRILLFLAELGYLE